MLVPNKNALCYISEQCCYPEDNANFGYEVHKTDDPSRWYLTFTATLQSFGVRNRNRRFYDANNVMDVINSSDYIQSCLRNNNWIGELDHPESPFKGSQLSVQRLGNPDPKTDSHYIRRPHLEGNLLRAPIQTDSATAEGMNLAIKIVDGKIMPCYSARVMGEMRNIDGRPTVWVKRLVTYDFVLYPSHPEATADIKVEQITESVNELEGLDGTTIVYLGELARLAANSSKETAWLCESFDLTIDDVVGLTSTGNSVVIREGANTYVQPLTDSRIRSMTISAVRDFIGGGRR